MNVIIDTDEKLQALVNMKEPNRALAAADESCLMNTYATQAAIHDNAIEMGVRLGTLRHGNQKIFEVSVDYDTLYRCYYVGLITDVRARLVALPDKSVDVPVHLSGYGQLIMKATSNMSEKPKESDAGKIEEMIRVWHPTLDHLPYHELGKAARVAWKALLMLRDEKIEQSEVDDDKS